MIDNVFDFIAVLLSASVDVASSDVGMIYISLLVLIGIGKTFIPSFRKD